MKTILRLLGSFLIGGFIGLGIVVLILWMFGVSSPAEMSAKLMGIDLWEIIFVPIVSLLLAIAAGVIHIIFHEAGHLVGGLATGYRFISFRVFSFVFFRDDSTGKLRCKRFNIAGTGGQCLLIPPNESLEQMPIFWYNLSGVFVNIVFTAAGFIWFVNAAEANAPFQAIFSLFLGIIGLFLAIINGIPMKVNGVSNDGMNYRLISRKTIDCHAMVSQLRVAAAMQKGMRADRLPDDWFENDDVDYSDPLQMSLELMRVSMLIYKLRYTEAHAELETINAHRDKFKGLLQMEFDCEYAFTALIVGDNELAEKLLSRKLMRYIDNSAKTMTSKIRLQIAITRFLNGNYKKSSKMLDELMARRDQYLLTGEVDADIDICCDILNRG